MKKFFVLLSFVAILSGCAVSPFLVSPIVTGVTMWHEGMAHRYYNEESRTLYRATKTALKELNHPITKDEPTRDGGYYLIAGDEDRFRITIRPVKPHITEVKIRINLMGDKPYAELVYSQIDLNTNSIEFDNEGRPTKNRQRRRLSQ